VGEKVAAHFGIAELIEAAVDEIVVDVHERDEHRENRRRGGPDSARFSVADSE
jgi:hypothetical protein